MCARNVTRKGDETDPQTVELMVLPKAVSTMCTHKPLEHTLT
jgi:hypothetical protein